jgi:hypothetical protein
LAFERVWPAGCSQYFSALPGVQITVRLSDVASPQESLRCQSSNAGRMIAIIIACQTLDDQTQCGNAPIGNSQQQ